MSDLVWQPTLTIGYEFSIDMDWVFAKRMADLKIPPQSRERLNQMASEELKAFGFKWIDPFMFYEQSALVTQISVADGGVWLNTSRSTLDALLSGRLSSSTIRYGTHNVDTSKQAFVLLYLTDFWVKYAPLATELK